MVEALLPGLFAWILEAAVAGHIGNRVDSKAVSFERYIANQVRDGKIINNDMQRSIHLSYIKALKIICEESLQDIKRIKSEQLGNFKWNEPERFLGREKDALENELKMVKKKEYINPPIEKLNEIELLLISTEDVTKKFQPIKSKLIEKAIGNKEVPECYKKNVENKLFELVCVCFADEIKYNKAVHNIFEVLLLVKLDDNVEGIKITVEDLESSLRKEIKHMEDSLQEIIRREAENTRQQMDKQIYLLRQDLKGKIIDSIENIIPTLPQPNYVHPHSMNANFAGRINERQMLNNWLIYDKHPILTLVAHGGFGKSSLAWHWLTNDINQASFNGIMWWSFYEGESSFLKFLDEALIYFSCKKANPANFQSTDDKVRKLVDLLRQQNVLLVMDGFERQLRTYGGIDAAYQSDEDAEESHDARSCINPATRKFLRGLIAVPATHARVLITTRLRIHDLEDKNGDPLEGSLIEELLGLNEKDAVDFMYKQGVKGDYKNIAHVCNNYGNHPLSLRLLSGKIIKDEHKPGNISVASEYESKVHGDLKAMKHHVLEVSYNALTEDERTILSSIAAFRSPMPYEALVIFNKFDDDYKFKVVLEELRERGLVSRDLMLNRYDLHPLVRSYAYKHLNNKVDIHMILRDYFATIVEDIKIQDVQNLEDITLIIELYIHTLYARLYNDAIKLYVDRLNVSLSKLGAYNITIDLLKKFFEKDPDLAMKRLCHPIAKAYEMAGYTRMSAKYYEYEVEIRKKQEDFRLAVIALRNLADVKISLGDLSSVESDLYEAIKLCQESRKKAIKPMIPDKRDCEEGLEKGLHRKLGILLTYEGRFAEAKKEMNYLPAKRRLARQSDIGPEGELSLYKLLIKDFGGALNHANYMLKQAEKFGRERDITFAEWLLGMIHFHLGNLSESEHYLNDAIVRCRTTNRVELEADILLGLALCEYAKHNLQEGISNAEKALDIANNREYRLKQADIHSSLGYLSLDSGNFETAKQHAQTARERSSCDGPPHIYKLALDEANRLLDKIQVITKSTIKSN